MAFFANLRGKGVNPASALYSLLNGPKREREAVEVCRNCAVVLGLLKHERDAYKSRTFDDWEGSAKQCVCCRVILECCRVRAGQYWGVEVAIAGITVIGYSVSATLI
jgi:hypothetical protein